MYQIIDKQILAPAIKQFIVCAPDIAKKAQPGQFIILRIDDIGERIP
ncbi:MAG TPA: sulfide/dihydroorotate dehydrogenase-like FAD/NAD-binding protein, partial [Syntrophomonas sp.]|nr:sulfide/dihydroorotate dehydrogenase-like FAD/NAD-binding protein [Syntrophomonas sp.]